MSGAVGFFISKWTELENLLGQFMIAVWVCIILLALLQCFLGYKTRKIWTAVEAVLLFGAIGALVAVRYELSGAVVAAIAVGAGLIGGFLGYFLWIIGCFWRVLIFVFAATISSFMHFGEIRLEDFINGIPAQMVVGLIVSLALGLICGILEIAFNRPVLIGYTAISGSMVTVFGLSKLIPAITETWFVPVIIGAALALLGILVQALLEKASKKRPEEGADWANQMPAALGAPESAAASVAEEAPASAAASVAEEAQKENVLDEETKVDTFGHSAMKEETAAAMEDVASQEVENQVVGTEAETAVQEMGQVVSQETAQVQEPEQMASQETVQTATQETTQMAAQETRPEPEDAQPQRNLCPKCGAEYKQGAKFCMKCGQKL